MFVWRDTSRLVELGLKAKGKMTEDDPVDVYEVIRDEPGLLPSQAMDAPFLLTASHLRARQTMRRRKRRLSTRSEAVRWLVALGLKTKAKVDLPNGERRASGMRGEKIQERVCAACNGTGYPVVKQPVQPGRKIYPVKCTSCNGKGKVTDD
jgi:DnaJ-class molecular chaperone